MRDPISYLKLQSITGSNAERIAFVDFKLRFTGVVKRSDLYDAFGLADATASRILSKYSELRPRNLEYDRAKKVNAIQLDTYEPLIVLDAETALGMLAHGFNKNKLFGEPILPYARVGTTLSQLDIDEVSKVTRAMFGGYAIKCCYISSNSSNHDARILLPLGLLFDGKNWIFRAYDRSKERAVKFKNFNFSRTISSEELDTEEGERLPYEELSQDNAWNSMQALHLQLHPSLSENEKKPIRTDFGMGHDQNDLIVQEKAALLWILTKQWNVDTGAEEVINEEGKESPQYFKFLLKNKEMVKEYI